MNISIDFSKVGCACHETFHLIFDVDIREFFRGLEIKIERAGMSLYISKARPNSLADPVVIPNHGSWMSEQF